MKLNTVQISSLLAGAFLISNFGVSKIVHHQNLQPNIIFIMADDLGYGDLGCYGQSEILTPNIDLLASQGILFTQCYTGSPVCAPSRSVLMTGRHTGHTTVRGNTGKNGVKGLGGREGRVPLKPQDLTVAECLKAAGYYTGCIGKWGLGEPNTSGEPRKKGFDYFYGYLNQRRAHRYYTEFLWENEQKMLIDENQNQQENIYSHDLLTEKALQFIAENRDTNFFLYLPYTIPHDHYEVPDLGPYENKPWDSEEKIYAAMISRMDRDIGRIIQFLSDFHLESETIIFFCSDNGAAQRWEGRFNSSGALRGRKRDLYEGGIRTPMVVKYPGRIPAGVTNDSPWYFADVLPTLASIVGATPSQEDFDGTDISPTLFGQDQDLSDRIFYWEFHERGFQQAVRKDQWKLINHGSEKPLELYDLSIDAGEKNNLAEVNPDVVKELAAYFESERTSSEEWPVE